MIPLGENIYMHPNKNVLEICVSRDELENLLYEGELMPYISKLTSLFKDDFDAYVFALNVKDMNLELGGCTSVISNQIQGIGMDLFEGDLYASHKRLRGVITLTDLYFFEGPLLHEICHLYAAPDLGQIEVDDKGEEFSSIGHWGISDVHGQLGGFDPLSLFVSGNKYRASCYMAQFFNEDYNGFNMEGICKWEYAPLELYLMGLVPISEVPDVHIYKGISDTNSTQIYKEGTFTANEVLIYTQDDLIRKLGKRVPDYKNSPKELALLNVVLTEKPLSDELWASIQEDIRRQEIQEKTGDYWPINYWEATGGRGSIKMGELNKSLVNDVTANEIIKGSSLRIVNGNVYSGKLIVNVKGYDWSGRMLSNENMSKKQLTLKEIKGNILVFQFADGSKETIKCTKREF